MEAAAWRLPHGGGGGNAAAARHRFAHSAFQLYFRHLCAVRPPVAVQKRKKKTLLYFLRLCNDVTPLHSALERGSLHSSLDLLSVATTFTL